MIQFAKTLIIVFYLSPAFAAGEVTHASYKVTLASMMMESFEIKKSSIDAQQMFLLVHTANGAVISEKVISEEIYNDLQSTLSTALTTKFSTPCDHPATVVWNTGNRTRQNLVCSKDKSGQKSILRYVVKAKEFLKF